MATIETIQASGGDYTTPQAWYDAHKGDITDDTNAPYIGEMAAETFPNIRFTASTCDATHYFHLRAQSGAEFDGDFDGSYPILNTMFGNSWVEATNCDYLRLEHFVVGSQTLDTTNHYTGYCAAVEVITSDHVLCDTVGVYDIHLTTPSNILRGFYFDDCDSPIIQNCAVGYLSTDSTAANLRGFDCQSTTSTVLDLSSIYVQWR